MITLSDFKKQKEFLVCVDSDGCAMDTMDIKHFRCFGPCMVTEWQLEYRQDAILSRWNAINLYTMTRGINRFKGLAIALSEIHTQCRPIDGVDAFTNWVNEADELSNDALKREIANRADNGIFQKALAWSEAVNASIKRLPSDEVKPFEGAKEALKAAHQHADVAIVSSANLGAVLEEWERFGLLCHTDIVLTQNTGSKAFCIAELLKKGYAADRVLMCGDAPGDLQAAEQNGVFYYPILVKKEAASWDAFVKEALPRLVDGRYGEEYQQGKIQEFLSNLGGNDHG